MRSDRTIRILSLVGLAILIGGCASTHVPDSVMPRLAGNEPAQQMDYWHEMAVKPLASNDEAFHGLLLYLDGKDDAADYDARVAELRSRGLLPRGFNQPADNALERGTLAVALVKTLHLSGGVSMHIFGATPRYAIRELEARQIYPESSDNQIFSGAEFVGVIGRVQDYIAGNPADYPAAVVPPAPTPTATAMNDAIDMDAWSFVPSMSRDPIYALIQADPATQAASDDLKVVVTDVQDQGFVREDETKQWKPATKGMELTKTAEFRTGPKGTIQFKILPDQTVSVDRLTTLKILQLIKDGNKTKTDLGIQYGRTRYDLEGGGSEHQSVLHSPNATLAVRGTKVSLYDQRPFIPEAVSLTGRAEFRNLRRAGRAALGAPGQGKTRVTSEETNPAKVALGESLIDPNTKKSRTAAESQLIATVIARGGNVSFDRGTGLNIVRGGSAPGDDELPGVLVGELNFILRWGGDTNLDLAVITPDTPKVPGGEFVYPSPGLNISPSGGTTAWDHRGGPSGGFEVVYFEKAPVTGTYGVAGYNLSDHDAQATIDVYYKGEKVQLLGPDATVSTQVKGTAQAGNSLLAIASVGRDFPDFGFKRTQAAAKKKTTGFVGPLPVSKLAVVKKK